MKIRTLEKTYKNLFYVWSMIYIIWFMIDFLPSSLEGRYSGLIGIDIPLIRGEDYIMLLMTIVIVLTTGFELYKLEQTKEGLNKWIK